MTNKETLKKQIIYRSMHRGSKEMDILLGTFVERYIKEFNNEADLKNLEELLLIEDEILYCWYFKKKDNNEIPRNKVSKKLKNFKL
jgi:antitoxin CptB